MRAKRRGMRAKAMRIPGKMLECAAGCGSLVVGQLYCNRCEQGVELDAELREKLRARMLRGVFLEQPRKDCGVAVLDPALDCGTGLDWTEDAVMERSGALLAMIALVSTAVTGAALVGLWFAGKAAIVWLAEVSR